MTKNITELNIGLSKYVMTAYMALTAEHPVNGSQLSRNSGIPRARIYDVLRTLKSKGFVVESSEGMYTPIPAEELIRRLRHDHESALETFEEKLKDVQQQSKNDVIWRIKGYETALGKAKEMILQAKNEIYVRMFPQEGEHLDSKLKKAEKRGVQIKYISMEPIPEKFKIQVIHPPPESQDDIFSDRFFDIIVDRKEMLCGMFISGDEDNSVLHWGKNDWFVISGRDSLRHDFYHYFLHKIMTKNEPLTDREKAIYELIQKDR